MEAALLLDRLNALAVTVTIVGEKLRLQPGSKVPLEMVEEVRQKKGQIIEEMRAREFLDLPFPIGYGGLPQNEVVASEAMNNHLGITDPIDRKLNVLMWLMSGMVWDGDTGELYQRIKGEYHRLRHSDPTIADPCGICECGDGDGEGS